MKMKSIGLLVLTLFVSGFAGAQTTLKIATVTPEGSQWMKDMKATAADIKEKTDGQVIIKYYGGGSRGSDSKVLQQIRIGQLQGGVFTPSALMERYGDIGLYGLPMVFRNEHEANFVRSRMDSKIVAGLDEAGFVTFGFAATGFAMIMSNDPVDGLDDLRGKRVWVPDGDTISKRTMEAMSVDPHPLPLTDVYTALQTGALDIIGMSPVGALILQYHTKLKYVTDVPLIYTIGFMVVDNRSFNKISADHQLIVHEIMSALYKKYDVQNLKDDREAKMALFNAGLERVVPDPEALEKINDVLQESNRQIANEGIVSLELYEEMMTYVEQAREEQAAIGAAELIKSVEHAPAQ
jgi:TRAP-type C4-dicarboxylate transport system substrate-binding protein